jgi:periplasmic protein TonB
MRKGNLVLLICIPIVLASVLAAQTAEPKPTPAASRPAPKFRVSQGVATRNLTRKVDPIYPPDARARHIQGDVILEGTINREGDVTGLQPLKGDPLLVQAAMEAVKQWKYKPYKLNGQPVDVSTTFKISFHL